MASHQSFVNKNIIMKFPIGHKAFVSLCTMSHRVQLSPIYYNMNDINQFHMYTETACLVQWLARLITIQEVSGSIPGYTLEIFLEVQGLERGSPSLVRPIGQLYDMRSSEIRLRKLKLRLRDNALLTTKSPVLPSGSNQFSRSWLFGAVVPRKDIFPIN